MLVELKGAHKMLIPRVMFSSDRRRIVTAPHNKTSAVWHAATGIVLAVLVGHIKEADNAAFNPDGTRVLTACYDRAASV